MTVGELREALEQYGDHLKVVFHNVHGYYEIEDPDGWIDPDGDVQFDLTPLNPDAPAGGSRQPGGR